MTGRGGDGKAKQQVALCCEQQHVGGVGHLPRENPEGPPNHGAEEAWRGQAVESGWCGGSLAPHVTASSLSFLLCAVGVVMEFSELVRSSSLLGAWYMMSCCVARCCCLISVRRLQALPDTGRACCLWVPVRPWNRGTSLA